MNTIKKVLVALGLVIAAQGVAQAQLVTSWNYTLTTEFLSATYSNGTSTPGGAQPVGTTTTSTLLSWGVPATLAGQSSISITNPTPPPGTVTTTTDPTSPFIAAGSTLTHTNRPIFSPYLTAMHMQASLTLTTLTPPPVGIPAPGLSPLTFDVAFVETTNAEPCVSASPLGNPCNDIFVLVGSTALSQNFTLNGILYTVNVFPLVPDLLGPLSDAACAAAGQPSGCRGFTTAENAVTSLPFGFTVSGNETPEPPVPEPGSLALMGLGLMGFAAANRKRKNA